MLNEPILSNNFELLKKIQDKTVDLVLIDPPYNCKESNFEIKEKSYKRISEKWDSYTPKEYKELMINSFKESYRVMREGGSILVFGIFYNAFDIHIWLRDIFTFRNFITWFKGNAMPIKFAKQIGLYSYSCEYINYFSKGKVKTFNYNLAKILNGGKQQRDLLNFPTKPDGNINHPSQKNLDLIKYLVKIHSNENDLVLDYFAGSFTTALACEELKRKWICCDENKEYVEIGKTRINNYRKQKRLF